MSFLIGAAVGAVAVKYGAVIYTYVKGLIVKTPAA